MLRAWHANREADHHPVRREQAEADRGVRGAREHRDGRRERRADDEPAGLGRARADAGVRRVHARPARRAAGRDAGGRRSTCRPGRPSSRRGASGCATARRTRTAPSTSPCACRPSRRTPCTATRNDAMRRAIALAALRSLLCRPSGRRPSRPRRSSLPAGSRAWARSVEGRKLSYRWGYPGFAVSLLCRAVDATWAIEWEGEPAPAASPDEPVTYVFHVGLNSGTVAAPLRAAARRPPARHVRHRRRDGEPRVDGRGRGRRAPPPPDDAHRQLRRALRLHGPDAAPLAARGRTPALPRSCRRPPGARTTCSCSRSRSTEWAKVAAEEAVLKGGRRLLTADVSHLGPAVPVRGEGRGPRCPPRRARHRPHAHRASACPRA